MAREQEEWIGTNKETNNGTRHFAWFPEFLQLGQQRIRTQVRLLGLAMLVGFVAGLGAIVFYVATRVVEQYAVGG